jgi:hypothetical protein
MLREPCQQHSILLFRGEDEEVDTKMTKWKNATKSIYLVWEQKKKNNDK